MKPSSTVTYTLLALVDLAIHQETGPVTVAAVAKRQGIPPRYLEQLFNRLRRKGIVTAERGPRGGYHLRSHPREIALHTIFQIVESEGASSRKSLSASDPTASVWRQLEAAVQTTLQATTLETLVVQAREQAVSPLNHRYTFHI